MQQLTHCYTLHNNAVVLSNSIRKYLVTNIFLHNGIGDLRAGSRCWRRRAEVGIPLLGATDLHVRPRRRLAWYKYDISMDDIMELSKYKQRKHCYSKWCSKVEPLYPMYASIIKEMILMTESRCNFIVNNVVVERWLSNEQCKYIIDSLCTI